MSKTPKTKARHSLFSRFARSEDGVAALEFGMVAPAFFAVLLGVMELGRIGFTAAALHYAAEEGTRYAIVRMGTATNETIQAHTSERLIGVVDGKTAVITTTTPTDAVSGSKVVYVRAEMEYQPWISFIVPTFKLTGESKGFLAFAHNT